MFRAICCFHLQGSWKRRQNILRNADANLLIYKEFPPKSSKLKAVEESRFHPLLSAAPYLADNKVESKVKLSP
jgi:hypothetical protein